MRILYATDGAQASRDAAAVLARIGRRDGIEITVTSVNSFDVALKEAATIGYYSAEAGHAHASSIVEEAVTSLAGEGFRTDGKVVDGDAADEILRLADETDADLVLLGAGKERWAEAFVLGSVSTSVLHASRRSVLVVHRARAEGDPRALVATDGSPGAQRAAEVFAGLADPERCTADVISIAKRAGLPQDRPASPDAAVDVAKGYADRCAAMLAEAGFEAGARTGTGYPARVLVEEAASGNADLIVAGARGLGRVKANVLGSVSDKLVRYAPAALIGR